MSKIFVAIPSYQDPMLKFTVSWLNANASGENEVRVVVFDQYKDESSKYIPVDGNVEVFYLPAAKARGAGYARSLICDRVEDEDYFLSIDSHTYLVKNWDKKLINKIKFLQSRTGSEKVGYVGNWNLWSWNGKNLKISKRDATPYMAWYDSRSSLRTTSTFVQKFKMVKDAVYECNTILAGMFFAPIQFIKDAPFDPKIPFKNEETSVAMRSWTRGWRMYCIQNDPIIYTLNYSMSDVDKFPNSSRAVVLENEAVDYIYDVLSGNIIGEWGAPSRGVLQDWWNWVGIPDGAQRYAANAGNYVVPVKYSNVKKLKQRAKNKGKRVV